MPFCANCGNNIGTDAFCTSCGARAKGATLPPVIRSTPVPSDPSAQAPAATDAPEPTRQLPQPILGPATGPAPQPPPAAARARWTPLKALAALGYLVGVGACGFLLAYALVPVLHEEDTIPPPAPQLAAGSSQTDVDAPDPGTTDGDAWTQLQRIAARDRAALQSSQQWRAQLASSPASESAASFLRTYQEVVARMPNALLAWSGDWPHSYSPPSQHSWVILSKFTEPVTRPIIKWCVNGDRGCWAKRLTDVGTPTDNTDHPPADPSKN